MIFKDGVALEPNYAVRSATEAVLPWDVPVSHGRIEPVVLVHELPGVTPAVMRLGEAQRVAGSNVYMPSLFWRGPAAPVTS